MIDQLPEKPEGYTRRKTMHLNFGSEGGAATFEVFDPSGKKMPFSYQYDTRKGGLTGFKLEGVKDVLTWAQLREYYGNSNRGAA